MRKLLPGFICAVAVALPAYWGMADDPSLPELSIRATNNSRSITWTPYPAAETYQMFSGTNLGSSFLPDNSGSVFGFTWTSTTPGPFRFYRLGVTSMTSNALLTANVLNRLAYGPTPDELERVNTIGPQAYIDEQLAPETITGLDDSYVSQATNGVPPPAQPEWVHVSVVGRRTSDRLYIYMTSVGDMYIDDLSLTSGSTGETNLIRDGGFESGLLLPPIWNVSPNMAGSSITSAEQHSGTSSLHIVASSPGTSRSTAIWQDTIVGPTNNEAVVLSFWYLPNSSASKLTIRLSGSGVIASGAPPAETPTWIYATATGRATANPVMYVYINGSGEAYVDDVKLVSGTVAEMGPNLVQNGDFESNSIAPWQPTANFTDSVVSTNVSHSGAGSLHVIATSGGTGGGNSIPQTIPGLVNGGTYTLSFWYLPATRGRTVTARLSGSQLVASPDTSLAGIKRRLDGIRSSDPLTGASTVDTFGGATLADLRAWFVMNAVGSKRQLLEILTQFLENHFVTQHGKSLDYLDRYYDDFNLMDRIAADWEYREISKWRAALMNPDVTFFDLLKISAESPAMIVYLDTVESKGNGNNIANENYARELFELFCNGVDNGYDQNDIVVQSRAWTGWSVDLVDPADIDNPFAERSRTYGFYPGVGSSAVSNLVGVWTFNFKPGNHGTNREPIFAGKTIPARFGPPWAGMPYELAMPARTGITGIEDGYDVIRHLANLPFTIEFISVKLCRLFVHDDFVHGVYDYTDPNRSAEAELVRQCMLTWWNHNPRGALRPVLETIFNSELFRSHGGSLHKVKTPLEFAVSAVRALRSDSGDGTFTASTDGYSISGRSRTASSAPLTRMGRMMLFDRDSPDGYPETAGPWISAGTLAERIRFVQTAMMAPGDSNKGDGISGGNFNLTDPVRLLKDRLPAGQWNDALAVADFFAGVIFPGEGYGNLVLYRALGANFLNTTDDGLAFSSFSSLSSTSNAYDSRIRSMVAMLLTMQRFQEQ